MSEIPTSALVILFLLVAVVMLIVNPFILWFCWNFLVPSLFSGPHITFVQAIVASILLAFVGGLFRTVGK